jgi:hypothetical protein
LERGHWEAEGLHRRTVKRYFLKWNMRVSEKIVCIIYEMTLVSPFISWGQEEGPNGPGSEDVPWAKNKL